MAERIAQVGPMLVAAAILMMVLLTASMFGPAALSSDDFKNLAFAQKMTAGTLLESNTRPAHNIFRPVGMTVYWVLWRVFALNPLPYRVVALIIHLFNVALVYSILKFITDSRPGAALGALLFASQPVFASIFYDFGTIFELLAAFWFFTGIRIYCSAGDTIKGMVFVALACFLANNAKEMAITLPLVLLLYELLIGRRWKASASGSSPAGVLFTVCRHLILPALVVLWFFLAKLPGVRATPQSDPYFMDFSMITLGRGYGWYFNSLYQTHLRWPGWITLATLAGALFVWKRNYRAFFFLLYVFLTLIPVVFLVRHRYEFYWYIPFAGLCGLAALLGQSAVIALRERFRRPLNALVVAAGFGLLWVAQYTVIRRLTLPLQTIVQADAREHLDFVRDLRALARPASGETIYFLSVPRNFDEDTVPAATQVALQRPDVQGRQVSSYPPDANWRFRFENSRLVKQN